MTGEAPTRWATVLATSGAGVCAAFHLGKVPPAITALQGELGIDLTTAGWVLSLFAAVAAVAATMAGLLADLMQPRRLMLWGLALMTIGSLGGAAADAVPLLLIGRIFESAGALLLIVAGPSLIWSAVRQRDSRLALALWATWLPLGTALMLLASPLVMTTVGWRGAWIGAAMATMLSAVFLAAQTRGLRCGRAAVAAFGFNDVLRSRGAWLLTGAFTIYAFCFTSVLGFYPVLLVERMGVTPAVATVMAGLVALANVAGNLWAGDLARRGWSRWATMVLALAVMAVASPLIFLDVLPVTGRYGAAFVFSGFGGLLPATVFGAVPLVAPGGETIGRVNGLIIQGANIGQLAGAPTVALIVTEFGGWRAASWLLLPMALLGMAVALGLRRLERARKTP